MIKLNKTAVLASLGAGLEYYDFIIYAFLAQFIGNLFFPDQDKFVSLIAAFGVFALGYFVRPLGGLIFGVLGDRYGRKKVFLISIQIMAAATFLMGLMPSYYSIGTTGSILFLLCRLVQGIAFGAELPGATTFITEHSKVDRRGLNCAVMISFVTIGVMLGSFVVYLLTEIISTESMQSWGWRLPFLLGGILAVIAYLLRVHTEETPYFLETKRERTNPLLKLIIKYPKKIVCCCGFILLPSALVMFVLAMPTFFQKAYSWKAEDVYLAISLGYGWSVITLIGIGYLSDYVKRKKLYFVTLAVFLISCYFLFKLLLIQDFIFLVLFIFIYQTFISLFSVSFYPLLSENFPTEVRFTGIAASYNIIYALTSLVPLTVNYLYNKFPHRLTAVLFLVFVGVITLFSTLFIKDSTGEKLDS